MDPNEFHFSGLIWFASSDTLHTKDRFDRYKCMGKHENMK